jgi:PST family polysaccharide transporter
MAYTLMLYPIQNISSVLGQVLLPVFSRIQADNERFREAYVRSSMLTALIAFPVMAGMAVVADPLVRAVFGPVWLPVIPLFQILAPVGLVQSLQTSVGHIYIAKGKTGQMFAWSVGATSVLVLSFLIGVKFGVRGVAISYALSYLFVLSYAGFRIPFRLIDLSFRDFARALMPQMWISLVMTAVCALWLLTLGWMGFNGPWLRLVSAVLLGMAVYTGMMARVRPAAVRCLEATIEGSNLTAAKRVLRKIGFFPESQSALV